MKVVKYLRTQLPDYNFIHNKSVGRDCTDGHLFPDIRFDCGYYNLIFEIVEKKIISVMNNVCVILLLN